MEKKFAAINFVQVSGNKKLVIADKYVPHALYVQNKAIIESLGGEILKGEGGFKAEFGKVANAKKFIAQAVCEMSEKDYNASRKTEPKKPAKSKAKANAKLEGVTFTYKNGKVTKSRSKKASTPTGKKVETKTKTETKSPARKSKKSAEITPEQQKVINALNVKLWNRIAAAYDRANGGSGAVNFNTLGVSKKELQAYIPAGIKSLKASKHWAKAEALNITENMLG